MSKDNILFRAHRTELLEALGAVIEAVPSKDNIPILENVLLQPDGDRLLLRGTNLDLEIETRCELLEVSGGEGLTIAANEFFRIIKNMPESAEITFATGKFPGQVIISGGRSRFNLHTLPASDFPSIGNDRPPLAFAIQANILCEALGKVAYAMNTTMKDRPFLSGTFIQGLGDGRLAVVATNGLKIAVVRIATSELNFFAAPIVPIKTIQAIRKLVGQSKAQCSIFISDRKLVMECEEISLVSKLIDGEFPDYQRAIPPRGEFFLRADRTAVSRAITRVSVIAAESGSSVRLDIQPGSMQIELISRDGQTAFEPVDIEYDGQRHLRGFNPAFVTETLSSISTASFRLYGSDPESPGLFTPDGGDDEEYVVGHMRVS